MVKTEEKLEDKKLKKVYGSAALTTRRPGEWDGKECNTCH